MAEQVAMDYEELLRLTKRLIALESHVDVPQREVDVAHHLVEWFSDHGIEASLSPAEGDRANVVARIRGGEGPSLMLNGHLDTVPAGDMPDAFAPRVEDGVLWGRGACDMKGAVAAMCCAMASIAEEGPGELAGDLVFAGMIGEETGSIGVKALVDAGVLATYAVVGEPTELRVALAHKGASFLRVLLEGLGAHGSCPEKGVNAASYAARIVAVLEDELGPKLAERTHPLLGRSTINIGRICGGTLPNIVAENCEIEIDRRYVPGEEAPLDEIRELVSAICAPVEGLKCEVIEMPMTRDVPHVPLGTAAETKLAKAAAQVCRQTGLDEAPIGVTYWSDGGHLAANGIETIVFGPGSITDAHSARDHVEIEDLNTAADWYRRIAIELLVPGSTKA